MLKQNSILKMKSSKRKYLHILTKDFLEKRYLKEKVLVSNIARELGLNSSRIYSYMKYHNIPRVNWFNEEHRKRMSDSLKGKIAWNKGLTKETDIKLQPISKKISTTRRGMKLTEEHKRNIGNALRGQKKPPLTKEHKLNLSKSCKGKIVSKETKEKISKALRGKKRNLSKETKELHRKKMIGNNYFKGKKHSQEAKRKISLANKGRKIAPYTEKQLKARSIRVKTWWEKNKLSDKVNKRNSKISKSKKGVKFSKEHCANISKNNDSKKRLGKKHPRYIDLSKFKEKIIDLYMNKELNLIQIGGIFGVSDFTIGRRLKKWGIKLRNESIYGMKKGGYKTDDGHKVRSNVEREISNFLFYNNIEYIYDKMLNYRRYRCDFYISQCNTYIEYWGLVGNKKYEEKMQIKKQTYKKLGLKLLSIYPSDNIFDKLRPLLRYSKTQKQITEFHTEGGIINVIE